MLLQHCVRLSPLAVWHHSLLPLVRGFSIKPDLGTTHYSVLGVGHSATVEDIKKAFRQRAKELHPDAQQQQLGASDASEAFLRLVTAYEVLSNSEQRRLYDASLNTQLPKVLRRAAAAQQTAAQQAGADACQPTDDDRHHAGQPIDPDPSLNWRWGLADWARYGPAAGSQPPVVPGSPGGATSGPLHLSVLSALRKHQQALEVELHAALMTAFFGPKIELEFGQLPAAFELDERSDPALTDDLLHLVHGRDLLGVVQLPHTLRLEGATSNMAPPRLEADSSLTSPPLLSAPELTNQGQPPAQKHQQQQEDAWQRQLPSKECNNDEELQQGQQQQQEAGNGSSNQQGQTGMSGCAAASQDPDKEITDNEWQQLLREQHPLFGEYEWPFAASSSVQTEPSKPTSGASSSSSRTDDIHRDSKSSGAGSKPLVSSDSSSNSSQAMNSDQPAAAPLLDEDSCHQQVQEDREHQGPAAAAEEGSLGGKAAREAWQQRSEAMLAAADASAAASAAHLHKVVTSSVHEQGQYDTLAQGAASQGSPDLEQLGEFEMQSQQETQQQDAAQSPAEQQHLQHQQKERWQQHWHKLDAHQQQELQQQWHKQWQQQQQQHARRQRDEQQSAKLRHRRLWRWVSSPSADYLAADWSFSDKSDGVLVLQLLLNRSLMAVAVRDDTQPAKPMKVYLDGDFIAAVLDDVVMQPLTGSLMAVLYRYYTPGVHHVYFYLPNKPGSSRVLARLQRRWMPPSSTWLFPPRTTSHDRCSWVLEWEGYDLQERPGWLHPAVYVLTAACYSFDIESRRLGRAKARAEALRRWPQLLAAPVHAINACRNAMQWLQTFLSNAARL